MNNKFKIIFFCLVYFCFLKILFPYNNLYKNKEKKRYIVYECTTRSTCGGWADRLKGIMSAYAISLLTDRNFIIYHIKPCLLSNFFESNEYFQNESNKIIRSRTQCFNVVFSMPNHIVAWITQNTTNFSTCMAMIHIKFFVNFIFGYATYHASIPFI